MEISHSFVLLGNGEAIMDISIHINIKLILPIRGKEVGDTRIGFETQRIDISVEGFDSYMGCSGIIGHTVGGASDAVARQRKDSMEGAVGKSIESGEVVLISHIGTELQMILGNQLAEGCYIGVRKRSLAVMIRRIDSVDMVSYGSP